MTKDFDGYKKCPYCGKLIVENALICKHCNKTLVVEKSNINIKKTINNYKETSTDDKLGLICAIVVGTALLYSFLGDVWFQISHIFPISSTSKQEITLPGDAIQKDFATPKEIKINKGKNFRILMAQAEYSLTGMIVAKNTNFWLRGIMQNDFDQVVPLDFGIVWGSIADKKYLKKYFKFKSEKTLGQARQLRYSWRGNINESANYITSHISHNHIIPANDNVTSALLKLKKWDIVKLDGYLVDILQPSGYTAYTSLSRSDSNMSSRGHDIGDGAGGACEIFYVTGVQIGKKYYK